MIQYFQYSYAEGNVRTHSHRPIPFQDILTILVREKVVSVRLKVKGEKGEGGV